MKTHPSLDQVIIIIKMMQSNHYIKVALMECYEGSAIKDDILNVFVWIIFNKNLKKNLQRTQRREKNPPRIQTNGTLS